MKTITIISFLSLLSMLTLAYGMDSNWFEEQISNLQENKLDEVRNFLDENELTLEQDPEYYVVLLNYVILEGNISGIYLEKGEPQEGDLTLHDINTDEQVGFLGYRERYDDQLILNSISKTQNALKFFKSRLDIRFGIVIAAKKINRWDIAGDQLVEMLEVSKENNNKWTWGSINSMGSDPREFMIENIQSNTEELFRLEDTIADDAFMRISQTMITYYPELIYGYANLGALYLAKKEYDKAYEYFKKALQIDPNDEIVKGNMEFLNKYRK